MKTDLTSDTPLFVDELEQVLRARVEQGATRRAPLLHARWVPVAVGGVALVLLLAVLPALRGDSRGRVETSTDAERSTPGESGDPAESAEFFVVDNDQVWDRANWANLRRELEEAGIGFTVSERPVAPAAAGRIFEVHQTTADGEHPHWDPDHPDSYYLERGDTLTVVVGVASEQASPVAGLTLYDVWPELCDAIVWEDPQATATNLQSLGFTVTTWTLITWNPGQGPTTAETVAGPQPGTRILSVLVAPDSSAEVDDPDRKELMIELESAAEPSTGGRPC